MDLALLLSVIIDVEAVSWWSSVSVMSSLTEKMMALDKIHFLSKMEVLIGDGNASMLIHNGLSTAHPK